MVKASNDCYQEAISNCHFIGKKQFLSMSEVLSTVNWILYRNTSCIDLWKELLRTHGSALHLWSSVLCFYHCYNLHWMRTLCADKQSLKRHLLCLHVSRRCQADFAEWLGCKIKYRSNASFRLLREFMCSNKYSCCLSYSVENLRILSFKEIMSCKLMLVDFTKGKVKQTPEVNIQQ